MSIDHLTQQFSKARLSEEESMSLPFGLDTVVTLNSPPNSDTYSAHTRQSQMLELT